jgi:hypothetical protein
MDYDLWQEFKKETKSLNLTTCLVYRALIRQWIDAVRHPLCPTKMKNTKSPFGILRDEHEEQWIYHKPSMTLYDPKHLKSWKWKKRSAYQPLKEQALNSR